MSVDDLVHRIRPARGEAEGALVLFHGRGADENDLFPLFDLLDPDGKLLGVAPRGPLSFPPGGAHWYALHRVGYPDPSTFHETFARVDKWLEAFAIESGVGPDKTVLGGFSQGAVMAHALTLGADRPRPRALLAFSGFIPTVPGFELSLDKVVGRPAVIAHGTHDPIIEVDWGRRARDLLTDAGADVTYKESPLGHGIDPTFLPEVAALLRS